jgi:hypothetical protein
MKRFEVQPPDDYTEKLEAMFGPGYRIKWEEWLIGPGATRGDHLFCHELYRLDEWARTGVEPPPVYLLPRLAWWMKRWLRRGRGRE